MRPIVMGCENWLLRDGVVLMRVKSKNVMTVAGSLRKQGGKALAIEQLSR